MWIICTTCGALVADEATHTTWHAQHETCCPSPASEATPTPDPTSGATP